MTPNEVAAKLQHFNDWRRGHHDEQPDPRVIGEAIDAAVEMIDRLEAAEKERDALRAKMAEMERQEPIGWLFDGDFYEVRQMSLYKDNEPLQGQTALYALPGAQPAPSVPDGFAWPECPKRRQSHVLFDDGYEEGWAACVATIKAALAAPEPKP